MSEVTKEFLTDLGFSIVEKGINYKTACYYDKSGNGKIEVAINGLSDTAQYAHVTFFIGGNIGVSQESIMNAIEVLKQDRLEMLKRIGLDDEM